MSHFWPGQCGTKVIILNEESFMNIFVGNLPFDVSRDELREVFQAFGEVASAAVIMDTFTGKSKGFGFVEMPNKAEAEAAISGLSGKDLKGRLIRVSEAHPRRHE
jgi:RNA recognition motif-containing protein